MDQDQATDQNHASRSQNFHINKSTVIWNDSPASRNKKSSLQKFASQRVSLTTITDEVTKDWWGAGNYTGGMDSDSDDCMSDSSDCKLGVVDMIYGNELFLRSGKEVNESQIQPRIRHEFDYLKRSTQEVRKTPELLKAVSGVSELHINSQVMISPTSQSSCVLLPILPSNRIVEECNPGASTSKAVFTQANGIPNSVQTPRSGKILFDESPLAKSTPFSANLPNLERNSNKRLKLDDSFNDPAMDEMISQHIEVQLTSDEPKHISYTSKEKTPLRRHHTANSVYPSTPVNSRSRTHGKHPRYGPVVTINREKLFYENLPSSKKNTPLVPARKPHETLKKSASMNYGLSKNDDSFYDDSIPFD
uniref:Uncharacterized protein n=1 Tax=Acrobeloides nanus TaxID=290746 RepID=A0A914CTT4_9BILA